MDLEIRSDFFSHLIVSTFNFRKDIPLCIMSDIRQTFLEYLETEFHDIALAKDDTWVKEFDDEGYSCLFFSINRNYSSFKLHVFLHALRFHICPFLISLVAFYESKFPFIRLDYDNEDFGI